MNSGAVQTVTSTAANAADINELPKLLREDDRVIFADAGYTSDKYRQEAWYLDMRWCVNDKHKPGKNLSASQKKRNRKQSSIRARVEHVFRMIKQQFAFKRPAIVVWRKMHHRSICWWVWQIFTWSGCS